MEHHFAVPQWGFRKSVKMMLSQPGGCPLDNVDLCRLHYTEALGSTAWIFAYLMRSVAAAKNAKFGSQRSTACTMLRKWLSFAGITECKALGRPLEDLAFCQAKWHQEGMCCHVAKVKAELVLQHGMQWMHSIDGLITFIKVAIDGGCVAQRQWRAEVVAELAAAIDCTVMEAVSADPTGMPVLVSPKKARRLTAVSRAVVGLGLSVSDGKKVFSIDAQRDKTQEAAERSQMSAYLHDGAAALDGEDQVGCTVDCSSVKPSELLTLALTSQTSKSPGGAAAEYAMWLPPQAILFVCSVCSSYVIASYSVCALKQLLAIGVLLTLSLIV